MTDETDTTPVQPPSMEDMARLQRVAAEAAQAAETGGDTKEEKTEAVETAIKETARQEFPQLSDKQLQELAEKLAPIVVGMMVGPMTDGLIAQMQELEVVFQPGQSVPVEPGTPEAAAEAEAQAAAEAVVVTPPQRKTWAERFAGR